MNDNRCILPSVALVGLIVVVLCGPLSADEPNIEQPDAVDGMAGVVVPGFDAPESGVNQPGAVGHVWIGEMVEGAPEAGEWDMVPSQPGFIDNVGTPRRTLGRW